MLNRPTGTTQSARLSAQDMLVTPNVVDSSDAQFLNFVQDFAKVLLYWNEQGNIEGHWQSFFQSDVSFILADIGRYQVAPVRKTMRELKQRFLETSSYPEQEQLLINYYELLLTEAQTLGRWYERLTHANNSDPSLNAFFLERTQSNLHGGFGSILQSYDVLCNVLDTMPNKLAGNNVSLETEYVVALFTPLLNLSTPKQNYPGSGSPTTIESFWIYYEQLLHSLLTTITQVLDASTEFLTESIKTPNHSPQVALILGFYALIGPAREQLNALPAKQLDFYLSKVLQQHPLSYTPDTTFLTFQIAKNASPFIPAGTSFLAGTSSLGTPILYKTLKDLSLNQVQPKAFHSVYNGTKSTSLKEAVKGIVTANPVANSSDGLGAKITKKPASWASFGLTAQQPPNNLVNNPANLGFALASPDLYMSDGQRRIRCSLFTKDQDISALATAIKSLELPELKVPKLSDTEQTQLNTWTQKYKQAQELRKEMIEQLDLQEDKTPSPQEPASDASPATPSPESKPKYNFLRKIEHLFHPQKPQNAPNSSNQSAKKKTEDPTKSLKFPQLEQEFDTLEISFRAAFQDCANTIASINKRQPLPLDDWLDACIEYVIFRIKYQLLNNHHASNLTHHAKSTQNLPHASFVKNLQKTLSKALSPKADALDKLKTLADMTDHADLANKLTEVSDSLDTLAEEVSGGSPGKGLTSAFQVTDFFKDLQKKSKSTLKKTQATINSEIQNELQKLGDESHTGQLKELELQLMEGLDRTKAVTHSIFSQQWLLQIHKQIEALETQLINASAHALSVTPSNLTQQKWQLLSEMVPFLQILKQESPTNATAAPSDKTAAPTEKPKGLFEKVESNVQHTEPPKPNKDVDHSGQESANSSLVSSIESKVENVAKSKLSSTMTSGVHELEQFIPKHSEALDDTINTLVLAHKGWSQVNELFGDLKNDADKPLLKHLESHHTPQNLNKRCSSILGLTDKVLNFVTPLASKKQQQQIKGLHGKITDLQQRITTINQSHLQQTTKLSTLIDNNTDKLQNQQDHIAQALQNASLLKILGQQAVSDLPKLEKALHQTKQQEVAPSVQTDQNTGTSAPPTDPMVSALLDLNKRLRYWDNNDQSENSTNTSNKSSAPLTPPSEDTPATNTNTTQSLPNAAQPVAPDAPSIFPTDLNWQTLDTFLEAAFQVQYSTTKGWTAPSNCTIKWTYQLPEKNASDNNPSVNGILCDIAIDTQSVAPAAWDAKSCGGNLGASDPALQFIINQSMNLVDVNDDTTTLNPYPLLVPLELTGVELLGDTAGTRNFTVQNQISALNPKKPFAPFGEQAIQESEFYLGNNEAFCKKLDYLCQEIEWFNLPKAAVGFAEPYDLYNRFGPSGTCYTNASFTWSIDILSQGAWSPLSAFPLQITDQDTANSSSKENTSSIFAWLQLPFTSSTLYQDHTNFEPERPPLKKPSAPTSTSSETPTPLTCSHYIPMPQLPALPLMSPLNVGPLLPSTLLVIDPKGLNQSSNTQSPINFSSKQTWSDKSQSGFLRFTLQQPEYAFGASLYPEVLAAVNGANMTRMVDLVAFRALCKKDQDALIKVWQNELELQAVKSKAEETADKKEKKDKPTPPPKTKSPSFIHSIAKSLENGLVDAAIDGIGIAEKLTAATPQGELVKTLGSFAGKELHHLTSSDEEKPTQQITPVVDPNEVFKPMPPPPLPWVPKIKSILSNYGSHQRLKLSAPSDSNITFYQLQPFGCDAPFTDPSIPTDSIPLFASFDAQAYLYIGLENVEAPQTITLLFELDEATGNRKLPATSPELSYLTLNGWQTLPETQWQDGTAGFIKSGVLSVTLLDSPTSNTPLFEKNPTLTWLRLSVTEYASAACQTLNILSQSTQVIYSSGADLTTHFDAPLPAGTINKPESPISGVTKTIQPLASSGGIPAESIPQFLARVAERMRHKDRGITSWDLEHLTLQQFPNIRACLCLNNTKIGSNYNSTTPGATTLVIFPKIDTQQAPLYPLAEHSCIINTQKFLAMRTDAFLDLTVTNPDYLFLVVKASLSFNQGYDPSHYLKILNQLLIEIIAPWSTTGSTINPFETSTTRDTLLQIIQSQEYIQSVQSIALCLAKTAEGDESEPLIVKGSQKIVAPNDWGIISSVNQHKLTIGETKPNKTILPSNRSAVKVTTTKPSHPLDNSLGNTIFIGASS
ncbi:hypothetical protein ACFPK9_00885 [Rubritalea spongiae]|uniref:Uncharacterized protein n=1 Tax=Rubritalea spongiae TaxID=430797 RepID=A0ABW5DYJ5_9BACT